MNYIDDEIKRYELSEEVFQKNADMIFNNLAMTSKKSEKPKLILAGGQAGSGKTGLVGKKCNDLPEGAIIIDQDEIRATFPPELYKEILENHTDREEYLILKPYVLKMRAELVKRAIEGGYNVVMETAMQAVDSFFPQIQAFKEAGYEANLAVMSVPEVDCYLSTLNRYCFYLQKDGFCRRNTKMDPKMMTNLRRNLVKFTDAEVFDDIEIYVRGESANKPPRKIYSQRENPSETPIMGFDRGLRESVKTTRKTFAPRARIVREILTDYDEQEQIAALDDIERKFNEFQKDRGDFGE